MLPQRLLTPCVDDYTDVNETGQVRHRLIAEESDNSKHIVLSKIVHDASKVMYLLSQTSSCTSNYSVSDAY